MRLSPPGTSLILAGLILSSIGCASATMDAMNNAHRAMALAQEAQAEKYAPVTMAIATANYELARDHFVRGTAHDNRLAKTLAQLTVRYAEQAATEARVAAFEANVRRQVAYEEEQRKAEELRKREENSELVAKRYIALAQRRVRFAALSKAGANPPQGLVEIEVWVAPNGLITQTLILQGNPDDMLTRTVLHGLQGLKLDPFPQGMARNYLKLRVTIDTRAPQ